MCGRFTQNYTWQQVREFLSVFGAPQNLQALYNIAPTTLVDIVRHDFEGRRELVRGVRWGLIPKASRLAAKAGHAIESATAIKRHMIECVRTWTATEGVYVPDAQWAG
jgi:putative SOS response-associated peptidase YedK